MRKVCGQGVGTVDESQKIKTSKVSFRFPRKKQFQYLQIKIRDMSLVVASGTTRKNNYIKVFYGLLYLYQTQENFRKPRLKYKQKVINIHLHYS